MEESVQSVKYEMQRGFDSVHESLQHIPTLESGLDVVMVKLDQLLSQRGEGSNNAWTSVGREKQAVRESNNRENTQRCDNRVQRIEMPIFDKANPNGWVFRA